MRNKTSIPASTFSALFSALIPCSFIYAVLRRCGVRRRRPPFITAVELIQSLVFHIVAGVGSLAEHVKELTGKTITDGALSQRRALLPYEVFEEILQAGLKPKAEPRKHPEAFYHGLRLCGIDGTRFTVTNAPPIKGRMRKARTRRGRAAFPQVGAAVLVELGLHNPLAAELGLHNESEMELSKPLLAAVPEKSLLIQDRYYGVPELLVKLADTGQRHFLSRVRSNLKPRYLEQYADGSGLVEIRAQGGGKRLVREIVGRVQRGGRGPVTTVRLWTSLLDWQRYPAAELLALYARRWDHEVFYRELKVDMRSMPYVQSHTPLTAAQEIAAMILAYAVLVDQRMEAAVVGEVGVLRISFLKTLQIIRGLWQFLELSGDLLTPRQIRLVVRRAMRRIAEKAIPKRRQRSCPRAVRQPVSSWPRLRRNTYRNGAPEYTIVPRKA
jgi:hypothetical protein